MKKITPLFIAVASFLFMTSCSSNDNDTNIIQESQENQLQTYTLKRDSQGRYSIDFNVSENTAVESYKNADLSNEIILSKTNQKSIPNYTNNFKLENNLLKVGFLEENNGKQTSIAIEDENITFAKGVTEYLNNYSVTKNKDNTFSLNFEVDENVIAEFVYNENVETYEVHLSKGKSKITKFERILSKPNDDILKIDFVNHKTSNTNNIQNRNYGEAGEIPRKPRVIIELSSI
ncbi:conserved exported protein of unknown function [Tenacibaculum sp. 190524A02b]|uniref:hypothetical protein n=1 Tax=Tenacibaculum vairaonense TaxID=3137860 RepID=UPI0032B2C077